MKSIFESTYISIGLIGETKLESTFVMYLQWWDLFLPPFFYLFFNIIYAQHNQQRYKKPFGEPPNVVKGKNRPQKITKNYKDIKQGINGYNNYVFGIIMSEEKRISE